MIYETHCRSHPQGTSTPCLRAHGDTCSFTDDADHGAGSARISSWWASWSVARLLDSQCAQPDGSLKAWRAAATARSMSASRACGAEPIGSSVLAEFGS